MSTAALPRPVDPFAGSSGGRYADDAVVVVRRPLLPRPGPAWTAVTAHFAVLLDRGRLVVEHALRPAQVDNDLAQLLESELFTPGWASGADTFERLMTGVVLSCHDDALTAWEGFYRATLRRLDGLVGAPAPSVAVAEGTLAGYAPVYARAESLVAGARAASVLDLGSCFGFFPLRLAAAGTGVRAADLSPGTGALLSAVSARLGTPVPVLVCDAACVPLPDASVDVVTVLHVLEHLEPAHGTAVVAEAVRLARRRVVVAVPLETTPDAAFGHVRTVSPADLAAWGAAHAGSGPWRAGVEEHHGGWLVLDRLLPPSRG